MSSPASLTLVGDLFHYVGSLFAHHASLRAENAFLRKQLAMFVERGMRPRRATRTERIWLVVLAKLCDWRGALVVVTPRTFIAWQRDLVHMLWRWKSRATGRPQLPLDARKLIVRMADENPSWSPRRIADELRLKLAIRVSPQTVRRYLPYDDPRKKRNGVPRGDQRWATFVRNHAHAIVACDFAVSVTLGLQTLYILVVMEVGSRRILHTNVTMHPTAEWTTQQLREAIRTDGTHRFLLHDRDSIFSEDLDTSITRLGVRVLKSPPRSPKANAFCERLIGTLRRECLDWIIPLNERQVRSVVREWAAHYNRGRPHMALGPGLPDAPEGLPLAERESRHELPRGATIQSRAILGRLHHEYELRDAA